jgi:MFS family permease
MLYIVLLTGQSYGGLVFGVPPPVMADLARAYGGGAEGAFNAQLATGLPALGMVIAGLISGWLFERAGLRRPILGSLLAFALLGSAVIIIDASWLMLGTRLLLGFVTGLLAPGITTLVAQTYDGPARARVIGLQIGIGSLATLAAILISGATAQYIGWRAPFAIYGVVGLLAFLLALPSVTGGRPPAAASVSSEWGILRHLWSIYIVSGLLFIVTIGVGAQIPLLLTDHGVTAQVVQAVVVGTVTVFSTAGAFAYGRVRRALGGKRNFALALLMCGAGMGVIGVSRGAVDAGIGAALVGSAMGLFIPHLWSLTAELTPEPVRGRALGYLNTAMYVGGFAYPFAFTSLLNMFGRGGACIAIGVVLAGAAVATVVAKAGAFTVR